MQRCTWGETDKETEIDRQTGRQKETDRQTRRQKETDRQTRRQRERETERERQSQLTDNGVHSNRELGAQDQRVLPPETQRQFRVRNRHRMTLTSITTTTASMAGIPVTVSEGGRDRPGVDTLAGPG